MLELDTGADHARASVFGEVGVNVTVLRKALRVQAAEQEIVA
jgi:hypothetical protein